MRILATVRQDFSRISIILENNSIEIEQRNFALQKLSTGIWEAFISLPIPVGTAPYKDGIKGEMNTILTATFLIVSQTLTSARGVRETTVVVVLTGARSYLIHLSGICFPLIVEGESIANE